ncbi:hypothetical protein S40293_07345 [Stachybotrys chartarum IBT 40293]|nr:hypothetical protein S40293_07345 [Stachybotrys chartarum IBT 40293]
MSENQSKRKRGQDGPAPGFKKRKGGSAGKWQTPQQKSKLADKIDMGTVLDVGDEGIWVTYARGMRSKAVREFQELCENYGKELYGIEPPNADKPKDDGTEEEDIDKAIEQELNDMRTSQKPKTRQVFTPVAVALECVFFMKTMKPVEPDTLVLKMCQDARDCPDPMQRKCRYVNRLTPVVHTDKASDSGMERVARSVLTPHFQLVPGSENGGVEGTADPKEVSGETRETFTYAIRHAIRNTTLKSDVVIKKVAGLIRPEHKVNLGQPDKVILVEVFQNFAGMSVVDGREWEALKRFNVNELYKLSEVKDDGETTAEKQDKKTDAVE